MTARVLVVDDIPANVKLLEARLSAEYFDVITASCGAEAIEICQRGECDIVLLDDGFQHRRLARDFDLVLLDATEPFGFDHLLPRGTLREPVAGLRRAQAVVLSRADMIDAAAREAAPSQTRVRVSKYSALRAGSRLRSQAA